MAEVKKSDMIAWIDNEIAENVDLMISLFPDGEEEHRERSPLAQSNLMLARIKDALREMTAVEYLEARTAMCEQYLEHDLYHRCDLCPLVDCKVGEKYDPRRAVEIVKRWEEERDGND